MPVELRVPSLGESIVDAVIARWLKHEGDAVRKDEPLVELETDKVNVEVPSPENGVLEQITKQEGDTVAVGEILGTIGQGAGAAGEAAPTPAPATAPVEQPATARAETARPATPLARRVAEENNIDLSKVQPGGPGEKVRKEDVVNFMAKDGQQPEPKVQEQLPTEPKLPAPTWGASSTEVAKTPAPRQPAPAQKPAPAPTSTTAPEEAEGRVERVRMSRRRQTIARRLVEAQQTAAMLTTFNEADMTKVMDIRSRRRESFKERHNVSLGFMSFFTKAAVGALRAFPRLNAEIQGDEILLKHYYDIGIAVGATEGLVVPVVRDVDRKSFAEIEHEIGELAQKARSNTLTLSELQGGTFTITNGGVYGSLLSTPILNGPQTGILGMHKIEQRPIALNGEVVIRPMMYLALTYDHRVVDGQEAVRFLVLIKELIEDPETLLLEG